MAWPCGWQGGAWRARAGWVPGDLYVVVRTRSDPRFQRDGADLWRQEILPLQTPCWELNWKYKRWKEARQRWIFRWHSAGDGAASAGQRFAPVRRERKRGLYLQSRYWSRTNSAARSANFMSNCGAGGKSNGISGVGAVQRAGLAWLSAKTGSERFMYNLNEGKAMKTPLQITFRDIERSDALETHIREKAEKLETFFERSCPAGWWLKCRTSTRIRASSSTCASTSGCGKRNRGEP